MGSFFTNIHVHAGTADPQEARRRVLDAVKAFVLQGGFLEAAEGETPDRTVAVGPAGSAWIPVFDEATEDQDTGKLSALAAALSSAAGSAAVCVMVHDSDVLELALFRGGKRADAYVNNPEYFGKASKQVRDAAAGKPELWEDLLKPGASVDDLGNAWAEAPLFAEGILMKTAEMLGWSPEHAANGYNYLDKQGPGITLLGFRLKERPAHEKKAEGLTAFRMASYSPRIEPCAGDLTQIHASVSNSGGGSTGISVVVWGPAVTDGLIRPESLSAYTGADVGLNAQNASGAAAQKAFSSPKAPFTETATEEGPVWKAAFPDFNVPAGVLSAFSRGLPEPGQHMKAMQAMFATQVHVAVETRILKEGSGDVHVGFIPLANAKAGAAVHTMQVMARPSPRRPLRSTPAAPSLAMAQMEMPSILFAIAVLGPDRKASALAAARAMEKWHGILPPGEAKAYRTFLSVDMGTAVKQGTVPFKNFASSAKWKAAREAFESCLLFSAQPKVESRPEDFMEGRFGHGFSLATTYFTINLDKDPALPHLCLWMDLSGLEPSVVESARGTLRAVIEDALLAADGVQAFMDRWRWNPGGSAEMTLYETACGIHGQVTPRRSWCTRWLRAVTGDTLWLGPELLALLDSTSGIEACADVSPLGRGARISLRDRSGMDALEKALEKLLPSAEDWMAAMQAMMRRD